MYVVLHTIQHTTMKRTITSATKVDRFQSVVFVLVAIPEFFQFQQLLLQFIIGVSHVI